MNFLLVLLWAFAMPYCRFRHMASCLSTVWTCIIIVCKMLYQLKIVDPNEYSSNCTQVPGRPCWGDARFLGRFWQHGGVPWLEVGSGDGGEGC